MTARIRAIETAVPATALAQPAVRDLLGRQEGMSRLGRRRLHAAFDASGIDVRHTVLSELASDASETPTAALLYDRDADRILTPGTGARNDAYVRTAPDLFTTAAARALAAVPALGPDDVTHVITVSCTGFFAPGPDYLIVRALGLAATVQRYHLGFMGCYAAFPALRMARTACAADPDAVVLVVCAELCSLHLHLADDIDTIVSSSVFADGAAAALVTARPAGPGPTLEVSAMSSTLATGSEQEMAWTVGDQGFDMVLSGAVPRIIEAEVGAALQPLLPDSAPLTGAHVGRWAVHPGGRSVLDRVARVLELSPEQMRPSREVLRAFGNMSSATIWFILRDHLHAEPAADEQVCAMAFGPGLTVESALLRRSVAA